MLGSSESHVSMPLIREGRLERRSYQLLIFEKSKDKNALVVLPTGLGKTVVAVLCSAYHLQKSPDNQIIFMAPTKPLVSQHMQVFKDLLELEPEQLMLLTGEVTPTERERVWSYAKVIFATPQTVYNDMVTGRFSLQNISLIIFDEAHRAVRNYAYTFIAERYLSEAERPRILALTASPGSEKQKILEICKNLGVEHIEVRSDSSSDVKPYVQDVKVEWRYVTLPQLYLEVKRLLETLLRERMRVLATEGYLEGIDPSRVSRRVLLDLKNHLGAALQSGSNPDAMRMMGLVAMAIRLSHAEELLEAQGLPSLKVYLEKIEKQAHRGGPTSSLKFLVSEPEWIKIQYLLGTEEAGRLEHPKLPVLRQAVLEELRRNPETRIIVFVHFRETARAIEEALGGLTGVRPIRFFGQAAREGEGGLTQKRQIQILDGFRRGETNVLVATQVAEEGLDISECDLVVFYDNVPSAIRFIQRAGRTGRRHQGQVVVLIAKGTRDEAFYWSAIHKRNRMRSLLGEMKTIGETLNRDRNASKGLESYIKAPAQEATPQASEARLKVVVDTRELHSPVAHELSKLGVEIIPETLEVGDYILSGDVIVERKTLNDFVNSILDKRLFEQLKLLKQSYSTPVILLEREETLQRAFNPDALYGAISSVLIDFAVPVIWSDNAQVSAKYLHTIARREQRERRKLIAIKSGKVPPTPNEQLERVVGNLPDVDAVRAKHLLASYRSLQNLFSASEEDLKDVEGIGPVLARRLSSLFSHDYESK